MPRAENRKHHIIYKTTCLVNDKFYIGMHSTDDLSDGYMGSGKRIRYSLVKHGIENHVCEVLEFISTRGELKLREAEIINDVMLNEKLCMNIRLGGSGGWEHLSREQLLDACSKGGKKGGFVNRHLWPSETEIKCRKHASDAMKRLHAEGKIRHDGMLGKQHTEETKAQMSESHKGENNSQSGTCWINNPELKENKKIKKEELVIFTDLGWIKGRKYY